jgi:hypothetical protein
MLAETNKCLAESNKSVVGGGATKKHKLLTPLLKEVERRAETDEHH